MTTGLSKGFKEGYAAKVDKNIGIKNDPNLWSEDPRYVLDLVKRIVSIPEPVRS